MELVVLVPELTQTLCDIYGGDPSPTTGVYIDCGHSVTLLAKCKTVGKSRGRLGEGMKPAGSSGTEPLSLVT